MFRPRFPKGAALKAFWRDKAGNITLELAFALPILAFLGIGAFDAGQAFQEKLRLTSAARAGTQYAIANAFRADDVPGIVARARDDANDTNNELAIAAQYFCTCLDDTPVACDGSCAGGEVPLKYVSVIVNRNYTLLFNYPGMSQTMALEGSAELRVR